MESSVLMNLHEEVTCPICLELLTEPLSLDCGHSFCQACITVNSKTSMASSEGESSCPICRIRYQPDNLRPNRHLANIVERLKVVKVTLEEQKKDVCMRHGEKLLLFCEEDGKVICWLCERSQEHHGHHTFLMEEVAQRYQAKLKAALERLRMEQKKAEKMGGDIKGEKAFWKNQIQTERENVQTAFNQLRSFLDSEEEKELQKLQKEEESVLSNLAEGENELAQQNQLMEELISDLEHRLQVSPIAMLQDVTDIIKRSETFTAKRSKTFPKKQRRVFQAPELKNMLLMFRELKNAQRYSVNMRLKPISPFSNVAISYDGRQARIVPKSWYDNNGDYGVMGCLYIRSGKHYWEVDVSGKSAWVLGVYDYKITESPTKSGAFQNDYSKYQPQNGYWVIGLQNQSEYRAFENSSSINPQVLFLSLTVPPRCVGVFLDYESRTVSFFNVTNPGFIYKFSKCSFPETVCPYFHPMKCKVPMSLCSPSS